MRSAHTVEEVRAAERGLMVDLPEGALMRRAAAGLAGSVVDLMGGAYGRRVRSGRSRARNEVAITSEGSTPGRTAKTIALAGTFWLS